MKILVVDWMANTQIWGSGIVIKNLSHSPQPISFTLTPNDALPLPTQYKIVSPWGTWAPTLPMNTVTSAVVIGPDQMTIVATTRLKVEGGYDFLVVREAKYLGEVIYPFPPSHSREWIDTPYWTVLKGPKNEARYTMATQKAAIELAAMIVYYEFPNRKDRRLGVMDAAPFIGQADGHPLGTHKSPPGTDLDVSYYTVNGPNNVQIGKDVANIWDGENLNANFDIERNKRFFELVHLFLPDVLIMVDERIYKALGSPSYMQGDRVAQYNHDKHAHIRASCPIDDGRLLR